VWQTCIGFIGLIGLTIGCERPQTSAPGEAETAHAHHAHHAPANTAHRHDEHAAHDHSQHKTLPAAPIVPGASVYQLKVSLEDQHAARVQLDAARGEPVVISMVYSSCTTACPLIVSEIKRVLREAGAEDHRVLLLSMDPERDDPAALRAMAVRHKLPKTWTLARSSAADLPKLAAVLGVRYRKLASGDLNHSQVIALLDAQGVIVARAEGLGAQSEQLIRALKADKEAGATP
jgi:protein SCO1/2